MVVKRRGQIRQRPRRGPLSRSSRSSRHYSSLALLGIVGSIASILGAVTVFVAVDPVFDFRAEPTFSSVEVHSIPNTEWVNYRGQYLELDSIKAAPEWVSKQLPKEGESSVRPHQFLYAYGNNTARIDIGIARVVDNQIYLANFLNLGKLRFGFARGSIGKLILHSDYDVGSNMFALAYVDLSSLEFPVLKGGLRGKVFENLVIADLEKKVIRNWSIRTSNCEGSVVISDIHLLSSPEEFAFDIKSDCERVMTWWTAETRNSLDKVASAKSVEIPAGEHFVTVVYDYFGNITEFQVLQRS